MNLHPEGQTQPRQRMDLVALPKKELLYPTPGTILVGREDFVALPAKKSILRPFGSTKLMVPLNEHIRSILRSFQFSDNLVII